MNRSVKRVSSWPLHWSYTILHHITRLWHCTKQIASTSTKAFRHLALSHKEDSFKLLWESLGNEYISVKEPLDAVHDACLCLAIHFVTRFLDTFFPANIRECVNLIMKPLLLLLDHQFILKFSIYLRAIRRSTKGHSGLNSNWKLHCTWMENIMAAPRSLKAGH